MPISDLVCYEAYSPNHYWDRKGYEVDTLTPHCMGGNCSIETCGEIFAPTERMASSNYGIGSDGRIAAYVDEDYGAWTSGSRYNDCRAITFECANYGDGSFSDACWSSLVALCADICRRYGFRGAVFTGDTDYDEVPDGYMLLTMHRWFQETDCPGDWAASRFGQLAEDINAAMDGETPSVGPRNNTRGGKLDVDGCCGYNTVLDMQHALGTYEDGVISGQWRGYEDDLPAVYSIEWGGQGSQMVFALQEMVGAFTDGVWGPNTSEHLQRWLIAKGYSCGGAGADGMFGSHSVEALQRCLNDGNFR
jgi:hypothetical protein